MKILKMSLLLFASMAFLLLFSSYGVAQVSRGQGVAQEQLPEQLTPMKINDYFVPLKEEPVGFIHALRGHVVVVHSGERGAYFAMAGDRIYPSDSIYTLVDSRCRVRFKNEDIVSIGPNGVFRVDDVQIFPKQGRKKSLFSLLKGKAMFYAMRLFRYRHTEYRVKTPTAVLGVRGTKFGGHVYKKKGAKGAALGIMLADSRRHAPVQLSQAPSGGWITDAICYVGSIDVNGVPLDQGEMYNGETGQVQPAPPSIQKQFEQDTQVEGEGEAKIEEKKEEGAETAPATTGEENIQEESAEQNEEQTQTVQEQTGTQVEQEHQQETARPTQHKGYFSAMLVDRTGGDYLDNVYVSSSIQDFTSSLVEAGSIVNPTTDFLKGTGSSTGMDKAYVKEVKTGGNSSGDLGTNHPVNYTEIGHNQYMEWGYWTQTNEFIINSYYHYFDNKGYYIAGYPTPDDVVAGFHGEVSYSGDAWGTYFTTGTGVDMRGNFSCNVNFDNGSINNFTLKVWQNPSSQSGYHAYIVGASGNFASSHFNIDTGTGTWELYNASEGYTYNPSYKGAHGSLYGPNGQYIGGAWGMYECSNNGAVGIFKGSK
jgi:hypothetical protein